MSSLNQTKTQPVSKKDRTVIISKLFGKSKPSSLIKSLNDNFKDIEKVYYNHARGGLAEEYELKLVLKTTESATNLVAWYTSGQATGVCSLATHVNREKLDKKQVFLTNPSVYITGIPLNTTEQALSSAFEQFGQVLSVKINMKKKKFKDLSAFVAFATEEAKNRAVSAGVHVLAETECKIQEKLSEQALSASKELAEKRHSETQEKRKLERQARHDASVKQRQEARVRRAKHFEERKQLDNKKKQEQQYSMFVSGFSDETTETDLTNMFLMYGEIYNVVIIKKVNYHTAPGQPSRKRVAFVNFKSQQSLVNCVLGFTSDAINVHYSKKAQKASVVKSART